MFSADAPGKVYGKSLSRSVGVLHPLQFDSVHIRKVMENDVFGSHAKVLLARRAC